MLEGILVIALVAAALVGAAFAMRRLSKTEGGCGPSCCCSPDARVRKADARRGDACEGPVCDPSGAPTRQDNDPAPSRSSE